MKQKTRQTLRQVRMRTTALLIIFAMTVTSIMSIPATKVSAAGNSDVDNNAKVTFENHSYQLFDDEDVSWSYAKEYCENQGGHLVTITSQDEQDFLDELIKNGTKDGYWIGANDFENEGDYRWITGEEFSYTNWRYDQPDNDFDGTEDFLHLWTEGKWNDNVDDDWKLSIGFICEWDNVEQRDEYFNPVENGNSFPHNRDYFYKESEDAKYQTKYFKRAISLANIVQKFNMYILAEQSWSGSCFGLELSMLYASEGKLYDVLGYNYYYYLSSPKDNTHLRDVINYFQMCQYLSELDEDCITYSGSKLFGDSVDLSDFLKSLVKEAQRSQNEKKPFLMVSHEKIGNKKTGHAVIICGYECGVFDNSGTIKHKILIYNCNYIGGIMEMLISADYSSFTYGDLQDSNGNPTWEDISFIGIDRLENAQCVYINRLSDRPYSLSRSVSGVSESSNQVQITISAYEPFVLKNAEGRVFSYDGTDYSGDMAVYSSKVVGDTNLTMILTVDASDSFIFTDFSDDFKASAEIDGKYYFANSIGADSMLLNKSEGVVINGKDYTFSSAVSSELNSAELVRITGQTDGKCLVTSNDKGVSLNSESNCSNVTVETYNGDNYNSQEIEGASDSIYITDGENGSVNILPVGKAQAGDLNSDGKIDGKDSTLIARYIASWDVAIDKSAADVNKDGKIDGKDSTLIRRYIAGWDVELG